QVTLMLNGVTPTATNGTFANAQLPLAYLAENKATWQHVFKARTGAAYSRCSIDNMLVNSLPLQSFPGIVQSVSTSTSYYVQSIVGICGSTTRTEVALQVSPPPAFAVTTGITACPYTYTPVTVTTGSGDYTNFTWAPLGLGLLFNDAAGTVEYTGDSRSTVYVYAATPGSTLPAIVCSALDGNGPVGNQCANTANAILTVGTVPAAPVITSSSTSVCLGSTVNLSAAAAVSYSTPSVSNPTADEDISVVRIGQGTTTIFNNTSSVNSLVGTIGTATGTAGGYSNFTAFGPYTLNAAQPVSYQLSSSTAGGIYSNSLAIFIDYNQDGDFSDAGEVAYNQGATVSGPQTVTGTFTIPAGALNGLTRMRVVCNEGTISGPTQSVLWGEWEDYAINITGGVAYTYAWTGGISATTQSVTSPAITAPVSFSATVSQGGCYSAPSNTIAVSVAAAPTITPVAAVASGGYTTPSVTNPTVDEDVDLVRLQVDFDGDGFIVPANGDYNEFTNTSTVNSLIGSIGTASGTAGGYSNYTAFG
ncbi:MAG: GEVED domain-containing protein, partial [Flavobacteriales bacterium]